MALRDLVRRRPPIASTLQADVPVSREVFAAPPNMHIYTTDAWDVPDDLPVLVESYEGIFTNATKLRPDFGAYDPWTWANVAKQSDKSKPEVGLYGEASTPGSAAGIVAEWGGMAYPVLYFHDHLVGGTRAGVLYSRRQVNYHSDAHGGGGTFFGPQQTAWEASPASNPPTADPSLPSSAAFWTGGR